jgi:hypothetical protein
VPLSRHKLAYGSLLSVLRGGPASAFTVFISL